MTDTEYLENILREQTIAPDSSEMKALQQHREDVKALIKEEFGTSPKIREAGSKAKNTMIKASYDLDIACYFPHEDDDAGESLKEIYENVEAVLAKKYSTVRKGSAIRLLDAEDKADFHIDVVPGRFVDGEDGDVFLYRSGGDKERLKTNLDRHIIHVRDSGVVNAIKLMKYWRERCGMKVKTFVLELLIIDLLQSKKIKKLSEQLIYVWEQLRDNSKELAVEDPANPEGNDLSELFDDNVKAVLSFNAATALQNVENSGWTSVFGELQTSEEERADALKRITVVTSAGTKPWCECE